MNNCDCERCSMSWEIGYYEGEYYACGCNMYKNFQENKLFCYLPDIIKRIIWYIKEKEEMWNKMKMIRKPAEFVGYKLIHGERFDEWRCQNPKCGMPIQSNYVCCPYCGQKLKFKEPPKVKMINIFNSGSDWKEHFVKRFGRVE